MFIHNCVHNYALTLKMKQQRHHAIRELLASPGQGLIPSQDDLRVKLAARGHRVTQATLSRDIRELQLSKGPAGYRSRPEADEALPGIGDLLASFALEVRPAGNLLVLLTLTGGAQPVAAGIDQQPWPEVVGTIAGDNTVLIICPDNGQALTLKNRIEDHLA